MQTHGAPASLIHVTADPSKPPLFRPLSVARPAQLHKSHPVKVTQVKTRYGRSLTNSPTKQYKPALPEARRAAGSARGDITAPYAKSLKSQIMLVMCVIYTIQTPKWAQTLGVSARRRPAVLKELHPRFKVADDSYSHQRHSACITTRSPSRCGKRVDRVNSVASFTIGNYCRFVARTLQPKLHL
ncbi:hypothetical protein LY76DRAFT_282741 [Colletotrichum caudatum]|nr:hypothetical protein LY76DRAFT_282741 [Colletotrichum caudatum]